MDLWVSFWSGLTSWIAAHGVLTAAVVVMLKSAGIPVPVPGDLLIVYAGADARATGGLLWPAWLLFSIATILGAWELYEFTRWIGADDLVHYGRHVGLTPSRLESAQGHLRAGDRRTIFVTRIVPGLRLAIVVACGILVVPRQTFAAAVSLAALVYVGICLGLGYIFGPLVLQVLAELVFPVGLVIPLVVLSLVLTWLVRARRRLTTGHGGLNRARRARAGALAGAVAVAGSSAAANLAIYIGGPLAALLLLAPDNLIGLADSIPGGIVYLFGASMVAVVEGVAWGSIYGLGEARWPLEWPDWMHGLVFAALPLACAVLLLMGLAVAAGSEPQQAWLLGAAGESFRWGLYGVFLGLTYPVFRDRRSGQALLTADSHDLRS